MKIFVSSTVKDLGDLRDELYRRLKELGHTPWFSEKEDFPTNRHPDAMTNCLKVAEECDLFVVLLDKRAGLPYKKRDGSPYQDLFGLTISEAEYRCARKKDKPVCIFIRKKTENESAIYRQITDEKQRKSMKWYSDTAVYEFYDRLMHEKPNVPWRNTFDSINEIMGPLNAVIGEVQAKTSVSYLPAPPQPYFAHPYPLQKNFTGRVAERNMLTEWLTKDRHPMLAFNAIGGMGKTALSWYWVQEDVIKGGLSPHGIIWYSFYEKESSFENFLNNAILYVTGGRIDPNKLQSTKEKMNVLHGFLYNDEYLLVLDGVERVLHAYYNLGSSYQGDEVKIDKKDEYRSFIDPNLGEFIKALASGYPKTKTLLTSRLFPKELDDLEGCIKTDLTQLDKEDAVEFFKKQGVKGTRVEIEEVFRTYGSHPLSLRLLSGMIVHDLKSNGDIRAWAKHNPLPKLIPKEHHILELAYNSLDKKKQALVSKLSAFRNPMGYDAVLIFNDFGDDEIFNDVLNELVDRGMLFRDEKSNKFDMHPVVRKYCYDRLRNKEEVHTELRDYFAIIPAPEKIESIDDLASTIELYNHTVGSGRYDDAFDLYYNRLLHFLYFRFGAYQTIIELLRALFPDGEDKLPRLKNVNDQVAALFTLANSYSLSGQSRLAASVYERGNYISENLTKNKSQLVIGLGNLATDQLKIGEFDAAEASLRWKIKICHEIKNEYQEANGHHELSQILAYRGKFKESDQESIVALNLLDEKAIQQRGTIFAYRSIYSLLVSDADKSLNYAEKARKLADKENYEIDIVRAEYLLGASNLMKGNILEADRHLNEALTRDRKINLVEMEPDILLEFAKLRFKEKNKEAALSFAGEALRIADRCEYRIKQADIHNFLAEFYLDSDDLKRAREHGEIAKERAECGYVPAQEKAEKLLKEIGLKATSANR
jgi:tetratricopeptide (TPR) repeat protein